MAVAFNTSQVYADAFQGLGFLPGHHSTMARAVSGDGSTVVGVSQGTSEYRAFRWTSAGGMTSFADSGGLSEAMAVSADGSIVGGYLQNTAGLRIPVLWRDSSIMASYWLYPGAVQGVSADGSVAVGTAWSMGYGGFRWRNGWEGFRFGSDNHGVSADGQIVVGTALTSTTGAPWMQATMWIGGWTGDDDWQRVNLGKLPGTDSSDALAISGDGTTIVGESGNRAFRWTADMGMIDLGNLPGEGQSSARAVSADGSIVVGVSGTTGAFVWDEVHGMRDLKSLLETDFGVDLSSWTLTAASGVSADGKVVVGYGTRAGGGAEAWIADLTPLPVGAIPEPGSILVWFGLGCVGFIGWRRR